LSDEYNAADDGIKSYYAAIEAKRLRGDTHDWERLPTQREFDAACRIIARCNGHDLDVWTDGVWPNDEMQEAIRPALSRAGAAE